MLSFAITSTIMSDEIKREQQWQHVGSVFFFPLFPSLVEVKIAFNYDTMIKNHSGALPYMTLD